MDSLVTEILAGKKGAATRFYRLYSPAIKRLLIAKLPQTTDAEDVMQEVFLSAFDSLPVYRSEAKILSWLYSIARHEVADFYRRRYVRELVQKTSPLLEELIEKSETPEQVWDRKKLRGRFFAAYNSLHEQYQSILSDRYELSLSVREIAVKMKLSFKATESLLYRARSAFAVAYDKTSE